MCLYSLKDPATNLAFEKKSEPVYDSQAFAVYKVGLDERSDYIEMKTRSTRHTNFVSTMKEKYHITFHELQIDQFDNTCLSEYYVYILATPVTLFLWLGNEIEPEVRDGALQIIKAFYQEKQPDRLQFEPSYIC